jgi:hypothetical protein
MSAPATADVAGNRTTARGLGADQTFCPKGGKNMALQRFTIKLTQLRCILESDPGPSEPYLWITYFALGPQVPQFQTGPLALSTPSYDAFRTEFPDNVSAGSVVGIPTFIASASFDMDLDAPGPKLLGCVAILLEEDDTRQSDMVFGRIAYTKEMEKQLNALMQKRIQTGDRGPLTDAEKNAIKAAVTSKVTEAVESHQSIWDFFRDQDDPLGFTYKIFPETEATAENAPGETDTIHAQTFDFPEITSTKEVTVSDSVPPVQVVTDRYVLSGEITIGAVPGDTVDLCAAQRAAFEAKKQEVASLQHRVMSLQQQLQHATPQQKPAIIHEIGATNDLIDQAEAALPALEAALNACLAHFHSHDHVDPNDVVVVGPGG